MDMADKLARLDKDYLSKMPKAAARPRLTMQDEQPGAFVELPYYTAQPKPDEVQCALAWYTGAFADRERQLGVEILLGALLSTNSSPLKAALLAEQLGADIDIGFDDSTLQPTLELLLRGATVDSARKFAPAVRKTVDELLKTGIPHDLLLAALNEAEFASLERPGSLPDGVLDAINAATGWLHTGDAALLLHTDKLFAALRSKLEEGWFDTLLRELFAPAPVQVVQIPTASKTEEAAAPVDAPAQKGGYDWRIIVPYVLVFGFYFIAEHGVMNWMVAYGVDGLGLPQASAAKYLSVFFGGMMIGRLCLSPLVDKLGALKSLAAFGGVSCVLYLIGSLGGAVTMPIWAISGLSFSILYPTLVMSIRLYFPAQQVSGAAGTILSIASLADILFNVGFGKLVDMTGYAVSIRVLPLSALAFFIVFMLFTKFCKPTQKLK